MDILEGRFAKFFLYIKKLGISPHEIRDRKKKIKYYWNVMASKIFSLDEDTVLIRNMVEYRYLYSLESKNSTHTNLISQDSGGKR